MRLKKILACCSLMAAALSAHAGIELTFEGCGLVYSPLDSNCVDSGVKFIGSPYTYGAEFWGGSGQFLGKTDLGHPTNKVALWMDSGDTPGTPGNKLVINLDAGFSTVFQMLYGTYDAWEGTSVQVFSESNGGGSQIGDTGTLAYVAQTDCDVGIVCQWQGLSIALGDKVAHSIVITAPNATYFFDNIVFGDLPGSTSGDVPEPTGGALALAALGALAISRRRNS